MLHTDFVGVSDKGGRDRLELPRAAAPGEGDDVDAILEALTQPGDLFYDASFGWGLYDFIQSEDDDLVRLEIAQRARLGLQKREVIVPESIEIDVGFSDDTFRLRCSFQFADEEEPRELNVVISAVGVEVITT